MVKHPAIFSCKWLPHKVIGTIIGVGLSIILVAQQKNLEDYVLIKNLLSEDGLSQGNISVIIRDSDGYTWIGTDNGLNRFDSDEITVFKNKFGDSTSISDNKVHCIFEDSRQRLWIGTNRGGLNLFNKTTGTFTRIGKETIHPFDKYSVFDILEDSRHNIWIATQNGLYRSLEGNSAFSLVEESITEMDGRIISILEDSKNNIWMGTMRGLSVMDVRDLSIKTFLHEPKNPRSLINSRVNTIFQDSHGLIWIGTGNGLSLLDPEEETFYNFTANPDDLTSIESRIVYKICEDKKGRIWMGTRGDGVSVYEKVAKNNYDIVPNSGALSDIHSSVQEIYFDSEGSVWIGTYGNGVKVIGKKTKPFDHINLKNSTQQDILCLAEDKDRKVWIGTAQGLYIYDPITKSNEPFNKSNSPLSSSVIKSLLIDRENNVYAGTYSHGLFIINSATKKIINFINNKGETNSLPNNDVWALCQDTKGRIWIGTLGGGINRFDATTQNFIHYDVVENNKVSTRANFISRIQEDSKGNIWAGTIGQGIYKFEEDRGYFQIYSSPDSTPYKINTNEIIDIHEDTNGKLFVSTKDEGLFYFDAVSNKFIHEENDNLQSALLSILDDKYGYLWMGTFYGLCKYNLKNKSAVYYTMTDGLQGNEFRANAKLASTDGKFYFGGANGINVFNPDNIKADSLVSSVILTDFYIFHEKPASLNSVMKGPIRYQDSITLSSDQNTFTITFTALNYHFPKKNEYAYMLENFDDDWNKVSKNRSAIYTNLPPGNYIFKVKATNNDGVWGSDEQATTIFISISPPFWMTWWFRVGVVFFAVGTVFLVFRYRVYQLTQDNIELERKVKERTGELNGLVFELQNKQIELSAALQKMNVQKSQIERINQELEKTHEELRTINDELDNKVYERTVKLQKANQELDRFVYSASHDLSAPLKSLLGLIQLARYERQSGPIDEHLDRMEWSVTKLEHVIESLTQFSRNIGHQVKKEVLSFDDIVEEVLDEIKHIPNFKKVKIIKKYNPKDTITSDYLRTKIILTNLLSNAIKYRNEKVDSFVTINFTTVNSETKIEIGDNGIGIEKAKWEKVFDMFYRGTSQSNGSGLGLYIVKETVEKLDGQIKVESQPGISTLFSISLPD